MTASTLTLADFLLARIAEDEEVARAAQPGPWKDTGPVLAGVVTPADHTTVAVCNSTDWEGGEYSYPASASEAANSAHIARWDPARVLAECEAKRRIVELHRPTDTGWNEIDGEPSRYCTRCHHAWPCDDLRLLALPYAGHEAYRQEWA